jgi:hypothetical protein
LTSGREKSFAKRFLDVVFLFKSISESVWVLKLAGLSSERFFEVFLPTLKKMRGLAPSVFLLVSSWVFAKSGAVLKPNGF